MESLTRTRVGLQLSNVFDFEALMREEAAENDAADREKHGGITMQEMLAVDSSAQITFADMSAGIAHSQSFVEHEAMFGREQGHSTSPATSDTDTVGDSLAAILEEHTTVDVGAGAGGGAGAGAGARSPASLRTGAGVSATTAVQEPLPRPVGRVAKQREGSVLSGAGRRVLR